MSTSVRPPSYSTGRSVDDYITTIKKCSKFVNMSQENSRAFKRSAKKKENKQEKSKKKLQKKELEFIARVEKEKKKIYSIIRSNKLKGVLVSQWGPNCKIDLGPETLKVVEELTATLGALNTKIPDEIQINNFFDDTLKEAASVAIVGIPLASIFLYTSARFVMSPTKADGAISLVTMTALIGLCSSDFRKWAVAHIDVLKSYFTGEVRLESQGPGGIMESVMSFLTGIFSFLTIQEAPTTRKFDSFVKSMCVAPKLFEGLNFTVVKSLGIVERIINFIRDEALGLGPVVLLSQDDPKVQAWMNKVIDLNYKQHAGQLYVNINNAELIFGLVTEGNQLLSTVSRNRDLLPVQTAIRTYLNTLSKIQIPFDQADLRNAGTRIKPVMILIMGPSGVGKSVTTEPYLLELLTKVVEPERFNELIENPNGFIYSRQAEHGFWDGYQNQMAVTFDDFGQAVDVAGNPDNEYMDIIRTGNSFQNTLHMAHLENKGTVSFTSRVVLATTNLRGMTPKSLISSEAVNRRFDVVYVQVPKLSYCKATDTYDLWNRRLDVSKLPKDEFDLGIYEFHVYDLLQHALTGEIHSWEQAIAKSVAIYNRNHKESDMLKKTLSDIKRRAVEERAEEVLRTTTDRAVSNIIRGPCPYYSQSGAESPKVRVWESEADTELLDEDLDFDALVAVHSSMYGKSSEDEVEEFLSSLTLTENEEFESLARKYFTGHSLRYSLNVMKFKYKRAFSTALKRGVESVKQLIDIFYKSGCHIAALAVGYTAVGVVTTIGVLETARVNVCGFYESIKARVVELKAKYPILFKMAKAFAVIGPIIGIVAWALTSKVKESAGFVTDVSSYDSPGGVLQSLNHLEIVGTEDPVVLESCDVTCFIEEASDGTARRGGGKKKNAKSWKKKLRLDRLRDSYDGYRHEGGVDTNADQILAKLVKKSIYYVYFENGDKLGTCTFIKDKICMMPTHFVAITKRKVKNGDLDISECMCFMRVSDRVEYKLPLSHFINDDNWYSLTNLDCGFLNTDDSFVIHPDASKYFVSDKLHNDDRQYATKLVVPKGKFIYVTFTPNAHLLYNVPIISDGTQQISVVRGYAYEALTEPGDCGALLTLVDSSSRGSKILGMHVAGSQCREGFSTSITYEQIQCVLEHFGVKPSFKSQSLAVSTTDCTAPFSLDFKPLREMVKSLHCSSNTTINRSKLYNAWGPAKEKPAFLHSFEKGGEIIIPMKNALSKYCVPLPILDKTLFSNATDSYWSVCLGAAGMNYDVPKVRTFDVAVLGIDGDPLCSAIPRYTSPGYPYCMDPIPGFPGKTRFFGHAEQYDLENDNCVRLRKNITTIEETIISGGDVEFIYADFLKDETRPIEKVDLGKTRLISACPIELVILGRMYFLDFSMFMMKYRIRNGIAVGVNPYSDEWNSIALHLKQNGENFIAGDYSNHDGSLGECHIDACFDLADKFYYNASDNDRKIRDYIREDLKHSVHINAHKVYQWLFRLSSGHFLTVILSSIANQVNLRSSWAILCGSVASLEEFDEHVKVITYGDDNVINVSNEMCDVYTPTKLCETLATFGMKYTNESKTVQGSDFRRLEEVGFLKRSFRLCNLFNRYVGPLDLDTIMEMLYWTKKGKNSLGITKEKIDTALMELSMHGEVVYNQKLPIILSAARKRMGYSPSLTKWETVYFKAIGQDYFY